MVDTLPNGLVLVANSEAAGWSDRPPWSLVEELSLGAVEGPPDQVFSRIYSVKAGVDGAIYVLDYDFQEVRVFAPDGTFSHRIGRRGEGPGELMSAGGMAFAPDGTLWLADYWAGRYSRFALDGTLLATRRRGLLGAVYPWPGVFEEDGGLLDRGIAYSDVGPDRTLQTVSIVRVPLAEGAAQDTVMRIRHVHPVVPRNTRPRIPYGPRLKLSFDAGERIAWLATSTEYVIYRVAASGDTTLAFSLDSRPAELSVAQRDSIASADRLIRMREIPRTKPVIGRMFADDHYVFVVPQLHSGANAHSLDVFEHDGSFVGRVESPVPLFSYTTLHGPFVLDSLLYVPWADHAGVERVSRLRIDGWTPSGPGDGEAG